MTIVCVGHVFLHKKKRGRKKKNAFEMRMKCRTKEKGRKLKRKFLKVVPIQASLIRAKGNLRKKLLKFKSQCRELKILQTFENLSKKNILI